MIDPRPGDLEVDSGVPPRALGVSLAALAAAGLLAVMWPRALEELAALVWLLALVPAFLFSYYRGWKGAAAGLLIAMILLVAIEIVPALVNGSAVDWRITAAVTVVFIASAFGLGGISEMLRREKETALRLAYHDALTGVPNRRLVDLFLAQHFAASRRGQPLAIVIFDLDGFKSYNDAYGHAEGDDALREFGSILMEETRDADVAGRYGGEEFLAILPAESAAGASRYAERVRAVLSRRELGTGARITVSAGVAVSDPTMSDATELVRAADAALYQAKAAGGNRVEPGPAPAPGTRSTTHAGQA